MKQTHSNFFILFLSLFGGGYLIYFGPVMSADSSSYLTFNMIRGPGYSHIVTFFYSLFSESIADKMLSAFQIFVGLSSVYYLLCNRLSKTYPHSFWLKLGLFVILTMPYFLIFKIGNYILTEAFCYPFFLWLVYFSFMFLKTKGEVKPFLYACLCGFALFLLRGQFIYLYVYFALLIFYMSCRYPVKKLKLWGIFLLLVLGSQLYARAYQYYYTGHFKNVPFVGSQLIISHLYVLQDRDIEALKDPRQQKFLRHVQELKSNLPEYKQEYLDQTAANRSQIYLVDGLKRGANYFNDYNVYYHWILSKALKPIEFSSQGFDLSYERDAFLIDLSLALLKNDYIRWFDFYLTQISVAFTPYYLFFMILSFCFSLSYLYHKRHENGGSNLYVEFFVCLLLLSFGNYAFVTIFEEILKRYTFYTDLMLLSFLVVVMCDYFKDKNSGKSI